MPKVNSAADVATVERILESAGAPDHTMIWAMLETPVAVLHAEEIATASARLAVLVMGTNDLAKELHAEHVPAHDCTVARLLREAGTVLLGKLNTHEYAYGVTTNNPHFGPTRNPWDLERIPSGSSGGSK